MKASERLGVMTGKLAMIAEVFDHVAQQNGTQIATEAVYNLRCATIVMDHIREDVEHLEARVRPISRREAEAAGAVAPVRFFGRLVRIVPAALVLMALPARAHAPERTQMVRDCRDIIAPERLPPYREWRT